MAYQVTVGDRIPERSNYVAINDDNCPCDASQWYAEVGNGQSKDMIYYDKNDIV